MWIYEASNGWQVKKWDEHNKRAIVVKEFATHSQALAYCVLFPIYGQGQWPSAVSHIA